VKKVYGITALLLAIMVAATFLTRGPECSVFDLPQVVRTSTFLSSYNLENLLQRLGLFGVLSLAAAFVIVTGGIDLSIGSVVCVAGCVLPWLLRDLGLPPLPAMLLVLSLSAAIGLWHGLLVVGLGLQPFIVTLCGLLLYRGIMRNFTNDQTVSFEGTAGGLRWIATGKLPITADFGVPVPVLVLAVVATATAMLWQRTVWGRHLFALGRNEEAARFAGIATGKLTVFAYVLCSLLAGLGGCLFGLDVNSVQASNFGNFYELYAIAGAVLGGVALRGGEGIVLGVVLGTALMQVLQNTINLVGDSNQLEFAVVGGVILAGAAVDEALRRWWKTRR
jgi:ribose transport system permease protein